jgi:hypothetical protein
MSDFAIGVVLATMMLWGAGIGAAALLGGIAWWRRSWILGVVAVTICLWLGVHFNPWWTFSVAADPTDPNDAPLLFDGRLLAVAWMLCSLACLAGLIHTIRHRRAGPVRMTHKQVVIISALVGLTLVLGAGAIYRFGSVGERASRYAFVHTQPQLSDFVGSYVLVDQTIVEGGLKVMQGRQCQLDVRADRSFSIANYPDWANAGFTTHPRFDALISTAGRWTLDSVGTTYDHGPTPKECWGLRFADDSGAVSRVEPTAFTGHGPDMGLVAIFGDPDTNTVLIFKTKDGLAAAVHASLP